MREYKTKMPILKLKYNPGTYNKVKVSNSSDLYDVFLKLFDKDTFHYKEEVKVLFFNSANNTIGYSNHSSGSQDASIIDIKTIMSKALLCGTVAIAIAHNHPSQSIKPSKDDDKVTAKLKKACSIMSLRLLDYIIVTENDYYSYADNGKI